jgi:hypothetical protein
MTAIIRATTPGKPVPAISVRHLSALMDIPEDDIAITPVERRGAGVRRLTIGAPDARDADPSTVWAQTIAPLAMPNAVLTSVRVGKPGRPTPIPAPASADLGPVDLPPLPVDLNKDDARGRDGRGDDA